MNHSIDKERFAAAVEAFAQQGHRRNSIGTLSEKSLHAVLKLYYEGDSSRHEIPVGAYVADIVGENGIIEIQTRQFHRLRPKLTELLAAARVTVVYPLIANKRIISTDSATGEVLSIRTSPKHADVYTAVHELYAIKPLLNHPALSIRMPLLCADEVRYYGVSTRRRKRQHTRRGEYVSDLLPTDILDEITLAHSEDYRIFLPKGLAEEFDSAEFAKTAPTNIDASRKILNLLSFMGLIVPIGKKGHTILYRQKKDFL